MALFGMLGTAASGMRVDRTWLDAISDNIANASTVRPTSEAAYQPRSVVAEALPGAEGAYNGAEGGVGVQQIVYGDPNGRLVYQPGHPLADAQGLVRAPDIDMADQMVQLIVAQRAYQTNVTVVQRAKEMYQQAMQIGK